MHLTVAFLATLIVASMAFADSPTIDIRSNGATPAIEKKLLADWTGGPCMGTLMFRADGTFERQHYSPGNNQLSGTWQVRWDALPPMLILDCTKSDDPDRVGKKSEVKLIQLNDESLTYQFPGSSPTRYERAKK